MKTKTALTRSFLSQILSPFLRPALLALAWGALASLAALGLLMTSTWLLATAALQPGIAALQVAVVGVRFFGISRGVFRYLERLATHDATFRILTGLRTRVFASLESRTPALFDAMGTGDLLSRLTSDIETLESLFTRVVLPPAVALLSFLVFALFAHPVSPFIAPWVVLIALFFDFALPMLLLRLLAADRIAPLQAALTQTTSEASAARWDLLAFGASSRILGQLQANENRLAQAQERWQRGISLIPASHSVGQALAVAGSFYGALRALESGGTTPVMVAVVSVGALAVFEAAEPVATGVVHLTRCWSAASRLAELTTEPPPREQAARSLPERSRNLLEAERLSFQYPRSIPYAVQDVSLDYSDRDTPAFQICGPSGSGKSTLASLLVALRQAQQGEIRLRGTVPVSQERVRDHVVLATRRDHLFATSLRENLLMASPNATGEEVESALRIAGLSDFVKTLPRGLETQLGDLGHGFSGGERQRLILARSLLRRPSLLILDETLSELDTTRAGTILANLLAHRIPFILVSHLLFPKFTHGIAYMDRGRIESRGATTDLLARTGPVLQLWTLQNEVFENPETAEGKHGQTGDSRH